MKWLDVVKIHLQSFANQNHFFYSTKWVTVFLFLGWYRFLLDRTQTDGANPSSPSTFHGEKLRIYPDYQPTRVHLPEIIHYCSIGWVWKWIYCYLNDLSLPGKLYIHPFYFLGLMPSLEFSKFLWNMICISMDGCSLPEPWFKISETQVYNISRINALKQISILCVCVRLYIMPRVYIWVEKIGTDVQAGCHFMV